MFKLNASLKNGSLLRPKTNHTCHQKPNPSRETVPVNTYSFSHRFLDCLLLCLFVFFGEQERNRSDEEVEPSQHCQNVWHYRVKDEALHCPGVAAQFT